MTIQDFATLDPVAASVFSKIPTDIDQAQFSLTDQLWILRELARKMKLYDACDFLGWHLGEGG